jgi:hypothetical protein
MSGLADRSTGNQLHNTISWNSSKRLLAGTGLGAGTGIIAETHETGFNRGRDTATVIWRQFSMWRCGGATYDAISRVDVEHGFNSEASGALAEDVPIPYNRFESTTSGATYCQDSRRRCRAKIRQEDQANDCSGSPGKCSDLALK